MLTFSSPRSTLLTGTSTSEGTQFAIALSPSAYTYYHAELIVNARQTTDVTITTSSSSEVVTVYGNWSLHYDVDYSMRTDDGIESKGWSTFSSVSLSTSLQTHLFKIRIHGHLLLPQYFKSGKINKMSHDIFQHEAIVGFLTTVGLP